MSKTVEKWVEPLLQWYNRSIKRFTWRNYRDWYRILIAEVMLIRTRSEVVEKIYRLFLERFPKPEDLCNADEKDVIEFFKKLGLVQRAKRLKDAVCIVLKEYNDSIPCDYKELTLLPTIGRYIANVLLTKVCQIPTPFVDTNVLRFVKRFLGIKSIDIAYAESWLIKSVDMDTKILEDINIAILDLSRTICAPRKPKCSRCPVNSFCRTYTEVSTNKQ